MRMRVNALSFSAIRNAFIGADDWPGERWCVIVSILCSGGIRGITYVISRTFHFRHTTAYFRYA